MSKENLAKTTIWYTIIMCIGYIVSFAKEAVVANYFGVSKEVDAYTIALQVPVILFSFVAVAIQSVVVPIYSDLLYNKSQEEANKFASNLLICVLLFAGLFFLLGEVFASGIIYIFAPGFAKETHDLATELLRITLPTIFFSLIAQVFTAILNVFKRFILPSISVLLLNTGLIATIVVLHSTFGIVAACFGQIVGGLIQVLFLFSIIRRNFSWSLTFNLKDQSLRTAMKMSLPVFWSISVAEVNAMVNKMVASFLFVGSIAAMGYAQKVNTIFISFFTSAIATIVYPMYAESAAKGDINQLNNRINLTLSAYSLFLVPVMLLVLCYRQEIIELAFARGAFDAVAIDVTQQLLGFYVIGILFMALRGTVTNIFYSLKDSKTPAKNATIGVIINVVLNLSLPFVMGVNGLALATSVTAIFITSSLLFSLMKKYPELSLTSFFKNMKGILLSAIFPLLLMLIAHYYIIGLPNWVSLIIGCAICAIPYLIFLCINKVPIALMIKNVLLNKIKNETHNTR